MPQSNFWILYGHLVFACFFVGGMLFFSLLLRSLRGRLSPDEFVGEVALILRFYHPFILMCMGVLIMTGAWYLTGLKMAMGPAFGRLFVPLGMKLGAVFVLIMGMSFQFFALGLRITRGIGPAGNGRPIGDTTEERMRVIRTVEWTNLVNIFLGLITILFGLSLGKG
jgi:uncharacterized membrane protein